MNFISWENNCFSTIDLWLARHAYHDLFPYPDLRHACDGVKIVVYHTIDTMEKRILIIHRTIRTVELFFFLKTICLMFLSFEWLCLLLFKKKKSRMIYKVNEDNSSILFLQYLFLLIWRIINLASFSFSYFSNSGAEFKFLSCLLGTFKIKFLIWVANCCMSRYLAYYANIFFQILWGGRSHLSFNVNQISYLSCILL